MAETFVRYPAACGCPAGVLSYDDAVQMVTFVLDDLGRPAGKGLAVFAEAAVLVENLYLPVARCLPRADQGQTAFFGFKRIGLLFDDRVDENFVAPIRVDDDDALQRTDHIGRHADTGHAVGLQRVEQVLDDGQIIFRRRFGLTAQEDDVMYNIANHNFFLS